MTGHQTILDLHSLGRHPGEMKQMHLEVPAPTGMAVAMIGVPDESPVVLELTCQSAGDGVLVQGLAHVGLEGQCARCLEPFSHTGQFEIEEFYYYPGKGDGDEEALFVVDDSVDLEPVLRAAVVLNLPFSPLCRDDCEGLCPICGADLNKAGDHQHSAT